MTHFFQPNVGLATARSNKNPIPDHFLVSSNMTEAKFAESSTQSAAFPLYLYPEEGTLETERRVNFDPKIYAEIRARAGLIPSPLAGEGSPEGVGRGGAERRAMSVETVSTAPRSADSGAPAPSPSLGYRQAFPSPARGEGLLVPDELPAELCVFDYIYGVLHSPDYRRTYAQFLKIDFPRIPYPASPAVFVHVAEKGGQLRRLHLMEDAAIGATPYPFKGDGDNVVVKPAFKSNTVRPEPVEGVPSLGAEEEGQGFDKLSLSGTGKVMINLDQYFDNVPVVAWEFHIGGYQPAQKWLKDRKGRALSFDDVIHYQKIIKILCETDRIMNEIVLPL